jgi:outer membrane protein OmpA-like peptidoglycan-associated protein
MAPSYKPVPLVGAAFSSNSRTGGSVPAAFDTFLYQPTGGFKHVKLTIKLKISLKQARGFLPVQLDADKKPFLTTPWTDAQWSAFVNSASAQVNLWNNRFWLVPPPAFSGLDEVYQKDPFFNKFPNKIFRPNLLCALEVDFSPASGAHRTIEVTNLNAAFITATGRVPDPGVFRSHAFLYDSFDATPWAFPLGHAPGMPASHPVIAHEIGHAIGLDHIGVLTKAPICQLAANLNTANVDRYLPAGSPLAGGTNALVCYGSTNAALAGNIMGAGQAFSSENARPWLWALYTLLDKLLDKPEPITEKAKWRVVMTDPGPGRWIDNGLDIITSDPGPVRVTANDDSLIRISGDVLFDTDKSNIKPEANAALEKAAADIKARIGPRLRYVLINGHTDATGSADYNQRLSEARAKAAADWFVTRKYLERAKIRTQGFGKTQPLSPNTDEPGRAKNRRVELHVVNS